MKQKVRIFFRGDRTYMWALQIIGNDRIHRLTTYLDNGEDYDNQKRLKEFWKSIEYYRCIMKSADENRKENFEITTQALRRLNLF